MIPLSTESSAPPEVSPAMLGQARAMVRLADALLRQAKRAYPVGDERIRMAFARRARMLRMSRDLDRLYRFRWTEAHFSTPVAADPFVAGNEYTVSRQEAEAA